MYPFFNDIGNAKVSEILPALEFVSADYNLQLAVLPNTTIGTKKYLFISFGSALKIGTRILRNSQRNN